MVEKSPYNQSHVLENFLFYKPYLVYLKRAIEMVFYLKYLLTTNYLFIISIILQ